jgi:hypothetical protein
LPSKVTVVPFAHWELFEQDVSAWNEGEKGEGENENVSIGEGGQGWAFTHLSHAFAKDSGDGLAATLFQGEACLRVPGIRERGEWSVQRSIRCVEYEEVLARKALETMYAIECRWTRDLRS